MAVTGSSIPTWMLTDYTPIGYSIFREKIHPAAYSYRGEASECMWQIVIEPGWGLANQIMWFKGNVIAVFEEKIKKQGGQLLAIRVWEKGEDPAREKMRFIVHCRSKEASPFPWAIVIPLIIKAMILAGFLAGLHYTHLMLKTIDHIIHGEVPPTPPTPPEPPEPEPAEPPPFWEFPTDPEEMKAWLKSYWYVVVIAIILLLIMVYAAVRYWPKVRRI